LAARVAAELSGSENRVETVRGGLGELRVTVDGRDVYKANRLLYPRLKTVLNAVRSSLAGEGRAG
jgi:hypothetical protein